MGLSPWLRRRQRSLVRLGAREARPLTRDAQGRATRARNGRKIAGRDRDFRHLFLLPSAVEIACKEIGLSEDDPRGLTVTGGLPYFGGPGNSYVLHSISEMIRQVRRRRGQFGLVTANGNYITKHSWGIYSTVPNTRRPWEREDPKILQAELDALPKAPFTETPRGAARIETYTIMYGKRGPEMGSSFVAKTRPAVGSCPMCRATPRL